MATAIVTKKQKIKTGVIAVGYAPITINEDGSFKYGNIVTLPTTEAGAREITADPVGDNTEVYANSQKVYGDTVNDGYEIKATLLAVCDDVDTHWYNNVKTENGIAEYADGKEYPQFAFFHIDNTSDGVGKTTIYYNCQCTGRPSDSTKTKESGAFDMAFPEYPIKASPRPSDGLVRYVIDGKEQLLAIPEPPTDTTTTSETT